VSSAADLGRFIEVGDLRRAGEWLVKPALPQEAPQHLKDGVERCVNSRPPIAETTPPPPKR
jgi:hypothetical protein